MTLMAAIQPASATGSSAADVAYLGLLREVMETGAPRPDRTGVGVRGLFGRQLHFDLSAGFPLLTTKRVHWKSVVAELLWFLAGDTNVRTLQAQGVSIWDEWAHPETGELGPVYGKQWRTWAAPDGRTIDQIADLAARLKSDPFSRRHVVSAWNPADVPDMALPPCHCLFQFYVEADADGRPARLSCQLYQRSADIFLGVPFNIASYALLTAMLAQATDLAPGAFVHTFGDVHLYDNHVDQAREQMSRAPKPAPRLVLDPEIKDVFAFRAEHVRLEGYTPHPAIKAPVAV